MNKIERFLTENMKHVVICMWIISSANLMFGFKNGFTNWELLWDIWTFVCAGMLTYNYGKIKGKDNLFTKMAYSEIGHEFRKMKNLKKDDPIIFSFINDNNVIVYDEKDETDKYFVRFKASEGKLEYELERIEL